VGITLERKRSSAQVRQQQWSNADVVINHLALSEPNLRVHHFVQVRELQPLALNFDFGVFGWHECANRLDRIARFAVAKVNSYLTTSSSPLAGLNSRMPTVRETPDC